MDNEKKYFRFIFILEDIDVTDDSVVDIIFESGCDDASLGSREKVVYLDFDREAETFQAAVSSAMEDVGRAGIKVLRVEPGDAVTASEIAHRLGKTREYVRLLITGKRGKGDFPIPISGVDRPTQIFSWLDVAKWCYQQGIIKDSGLIDNAEFIMKINHTLQNHPTKNIQSRQSGTKKVSTRSSRGRDQTYPVVTKSN
ncbi:MAG: hypothetical protein K9N34_01515 [Candidatus Marinimicrobia bacterium]|nr:hypothetical protein [Candidatus Neomarinimicrobiota bacterium]